MLDKAEQRLMATWFPEVIDVIMRHGVNSLIKSDKFRTFHSCLCVLLSNQIKEFLQHGIKKWTDLFLPENSDLLPVFKVELVLEEEDGMQCLPRYEQLQHTVVSIIDEIAAKMQHVQVSP